jgi:hypothetical protein
MSKLVRVVKGLTATGLVGVILTCAAPTIALEVGNPYADYAFLIGDWDISPDSGGSLMAAATFRWGPTVPTFSTRASLDPKTPDAGTSRAC